MGHGIIDSLCCGWRNREYSDKELSSGDLWFGRGAVAGGVGLAAIGLFSFGISVAAEDSPAVGNLIGGVVETCIGSALTALGVRVLRPNCCIRLPDEEAPTSEPNAIPLQPIAPPVSLPGTTPFG
jgi:hypothetical protein